MDTKQFIEFIQNVSDRGFAEAEVTFTVEDVYKTLDENPHKAREKSKALQVQRQGRGGKRRTSRSHDFIWQNLGPWAAQSQSSIAIIEGPQHYRGWVEEIAIETTELVERQLIPVAWSLNVLPEPGDGENPRRYTAQDIVAQFCLQFVRQNPRRNTQPMLEKCLAMSKAASTELEWFGVLAWCIDGLDETYIILDVDAMDKSESRAVSWPALFESMSKDLATSTVCCIVRVILLTCTIDHSFGDLVRTKIIQLPRGNIATFRGVQKNCRLPFKPNCTERSANAWLQHVRRSRVQELQSSGRTESSEASGDTLDMRRTDETMSAPMDLCPPVSSSLLRPASRSAFKVAIICALPFEADAIRALFDCDWDEEGTVYDKAVGDPNAYSAGSVGRHSVILVHMANMGTTSAAVAAASCRCSFPNIRLALVVGVCGGVPFPSNGREMMLGDVVVSDGVIQYDHGRRLPSQFLIKDTLSDSLGRPNTEVRALLSKLKGLHSRRRMEKKLTEYLDVLRREPELAAYPPKNTPDKLFEAVYHHVSQDMSCEQAGCNGELVERDRAQQDHRPAVHFGLMASANSVMKSAQDRDEIATATKAIAFEMEGAGVWDVFPCIVIKGVCDYADSHKNKEWQRYAAASAASCAKAFLEYWIPLPDV
ncbi:kinesin [Pochonia chlamydosporia 170]|uniref:Kinesin n=1 Tax=Pochonia chlamydosporia 170 TaxID=1380566 RepID=A0A179FXB4_METCM|nr:kinesin [Pochonia chlamydosporia 170]OAQ69858.1 kinesin [Pochonia chlamydosporia 170]